MNRATVKLKASSIFWAVLFNIMCLADRNGAVDRGSFEIWGPGLEPQNIVMPARYFFIRLLNCNKESIPDKFEDNFQITINGGTDPNRPCRIWSNILNRKDGSLIVRYKVYDQCSRLEISVKYQQQHVAESPYLVEGLIHPDNCYCPKENIDAVIEAWKCKAVPAQIRADFERFPKIDWDVIRPKVIKMFDKPHSVSLCHYVIKDNQVYRKCYGNYVGFNMFSDSILLSLTRKAAVPNLEFFVNLGDWPLSAQHLEDKFPILSWCGSTDTNDITMPTYELTESALENMGRVMLDMLSVQGNVEFSWNQRESKLFWRGRDSNRHRLELISLSRKHPELFNASLTHFFFYRDEEDVYGPKADHVSFFRFFDYKYQLAIDGTVAPYRTPFLLGGGSLIFKPHSKYHEYFYRDLVANTHYIPVESDLSDLIERIQWAKANDAEAEKIARNGQEFANENLLPQHIFCYYFHLLNELSKVMESEVRVLDDMELVKQQKLSPCDCSQIKTSERDEL